ncbi:MAG: hypothetical protein ACREFR_02250 [Limisphaerales bacterium]
MSEIILAGNGVGQLVDGSRLLEMLFPAHCRPSMRWLRERQRKREIPYVKLGRLVYFDAARVREALARQPTAKEGN